jgi:hypothetical protein
MLTRVSTALNLNITDRVVKEVYHQNVELSRAKWIEGGNPLPHRGGGKAPQLEVHYLSPYILAHCVIVLFAILLWPAFVLLLANGRHHLRKRSRRQFLLTLLARAQ